MTFHRLLPLVCLAIGNIALAQSSPQLAKGRSYTYSPPALYDLTRDAGDATQLTDGKFAPDKMWGSREAVGWLAGGRVEIEVDLGEVRRIGKVCLRTARGSEAEVYFPRRVDAFASMDRERYAWIGDLLSGQDAVDGPYLAKTFCAVAPERDTRYIRLLVATRGPYFFTDEVEVWGPTDAMPSARGEVTRSAPLSSSELKAFTLKHDAVAQLASDLLRRLPATDSGRGIGTQLGALIGRLADRSGALGLEQVSALDLEVRRLVRQARGASAQALDVRLADPWRLATPINPAGQPGPVQEVDIPQGGHGAVAVAIEHADDNAVRMKVAAEVLGERKDALRLTLLEVAFVTRADGVRLGDPLVPLRQGSLEVATGESRQLWVDVAASASASGSYNVRVRIDAVIGGKALSRSVDVPVRVWARSMSPKRPPTAVWGYLDSPPLRGLEKEAAADMLAHGVTVAVLPAADLPWPKPGVRVDATEIGDYRRFDAVIGALRGHRQFLFFLGLEPGAPSRFGPQHPFMSDSWKALFTNWLREWTGRLKQSGIGYDAFAFYPVDEPRKGADHDALVAIARLIKATDPQVRVYTTLHRPEALSDALIQVVDIFQLSTKAATAPLVSTLKGRGKQLWLYSAPGGNGGKAADPSTFYRAKAWEALSLGFPGFGFWAYADVGRSGTAWDDTDGLRPDFAVIYEGTNSILSSKRWEGWREGVQDYRLITQAYESARSPKEKAAIDQLVREGLGALAAPAEFTAVRRKLLERATIQSNR